MHVQRKEKEKQEDKVEQSKDAFQNAVDTLFGTEEKARKEWGMSNWQYENRTAFYIMLKKL